MAYTIENLETDGYEPYCYACNVTLINNGFEMHHYPVPKRANGTKLIQLCIYCHNTADRQNIGNWEINLACGLMSIPVEYLNLVLNKFNSDELFNDFQKWLNENWNGLTRETRLVSMKFVSLYWTTKLKGVE